MHIYILGPKLLQWNFLQISQLSIRSGAHNLFRRFLDIAIFDRNFAKIVAPPNNENENYVVDLKVLSILIKSAENLSKFTRKPSHNTWLNYVSPTRRQTKRDIQKTPIFALTAGARISIREIPKLCMLIENVVTILKGAIVFRSNA